MGLLVALGDAAGLIIGMAVLPSAQLTVVCVVLGLVVLAARGHHRIGLTPSIGSDAVGVIGAVAVTVLVVGVLQDAPETSAALLHAGLVATVEVLLLRLLLYRIVRMLRTDRVLVEPTVVLGAGTFGVEVARVLAVHPEYGLAPIGFVDDVADEELPLPLLGPVASLETVLSEHGARHVVLAYGPTADTGLVDVVRACDRMAVEIHMLPRLFELGCSTTEEVRGLPLVRLGRSLAHPAARRGKRVFDVVGAGAALVLAAPLMSVIALLVRVSSPGPVLFRQRRVGQHGRTFDLLKFRSMRMNDESDTQWSVHGDPRVTAVGSVLRRTSLDELPQLFNVLRGEMSLVGPRPERPVFAERFDQEVAGYRYRYRAPAGMTGWAQVNGLRGDTSIEERARFDNHYIENWSPWRDLVTLARTAGELFGGGEPEPATEDVETKSVVPSVPAPVGEPAA
ncbi:MAG: sugar transferase [Actinobacteria bacterium]|nr:sugar transferase [Actinomycetota bacterium]